MTEAEEVHDYKVSIKLPVGTPWENVFEGSMWEVFRPPSEDGLPFSDTKTREEAVFGGPLVLEGGQMKISDGVFVFVKGDHRVRCLTKNPPLLIKVVG